MYNHLAHLDCSHEKEKVEVNMVHLIVIKHIKVENTMTQQVEARETLFMLASVLTH